MFPPGCIIARGGPRAPYCRSSAVQYCVVFDKRIAMVSTSALLLGSSRPKLGWSRSSRFWQPTARSPVRLGHGGLRVSCVAAPEKPAAAGAAFTAWDTAVQRVAKRTDLKTIMLLGAGPIVIGQVRWITAVAWDGDIALVSVEGPCPILV